MIPTRVVFIIRMPSVKMEMSWVSLATCDHMKQKHILHHLYKKRCQQILYVNCLNQNVPCHFVFKFKIEIIV